MELTIVDDKEKIGPVESAVIKVIGVGGAGCNAVNRIIEDYNPQDVVFIAANTDLQALKRSQAETHLPLGRETTHGLGAGGNPKVGEDAANEQKDDIKEFIEGSDMVFITAGMGGGTGTGGAPVIAKIAKDMGILTVAVVTTPFDLEGPVRMQNALTGIERLKENVDALIVVPNQKLIEFAQVEKTVTMQEGFKIADGVLRDGILGIANLITSPGDINLDFADINTIMRGKGEAFMGIGEGKGENMAVDAITNALCNKVQENTDITGATGIILNITSGPDFTMPDLQKILNLVRSNADENVNLIFGHRVDETMKERVSVTIIATGFPPSQKSPSSHYSRPKVDKPNVVSSREWDAMQKVGISSSAAPRASTQIQSEGNAEWGNIEQPAIYRLRGKVPGIRTEE
ncbi:MAG: cell division protein FtsZ [Spirochaetia bacterium]|nr:cell division protein FtsZ [Spirochaetia bacterium]MBP5739461.1 cell division protein FtsZ [Spirochaetia bacterium]